MTHEEVRDYNWDDGFDPIWPLVHDERTDRGTALLIYWRIEGPFLKPEDCRQDSLPVANEVTVGGTYHLHWYRWFRGPSSSTYMSALFSESGQQSSYSRLASDPGGENAIVMFKSCYPNSDLAGSPEDPVPLIDDNPLKERDCYSEHHTVANAKGIYIDLLSYFETRQDKLFIAVTAPTRTSPTLASNARAFNNWLVHEWLSDYPYSNVYVFDFYNVLTTNGGDADTHDLGRETGNHHRYRDGAIQHIADGDDDGSPDVLEYPTGDDHPSQAGNLKATGELIDLLNIAFHLWNG